MTPAHLFTMLLALVAGTAAAEDAYLQDYRSVAAAEPPASAFEYALNRVGASVRGLRNRILSRPLVPRPGAQLHTSSTLKSLKPLPGEAESRLLVSSESPTWITSPGYLLRTGEVIEGRGTVLLPLEAGFDLHLHHHNRLRDRGQVNMVVELTNPNNHPVEVWLGGAIHSSAQHRGRWSAFGGYGGPAAATAEAMLTQAPRKGWSERTLHLHPGTKVRVITQPLPYGHEVDGYFQVHAASPVYVDVRAVDDDGSQRDDGSAEGWTRPGSCAGGGVYLGSEWGLDGDLVQVPARGKGRAYALAATGRHGQAAEGLETYADACQQLRGSHGVFHRMDIPLYNPGREDRIVQLLLSAPHTGRSSRSSYRWVGPVMVNGWLERVRLDRPGHAEVLGAWRLRGGEMRTVRVDVLMPSSSIGPSALEVWTLD